MTADDREQAARRLAAEREKRARAAIARLTAKYTNRHGVIEDRKAYLYEVLQEWGEPLTRQQIQELTGWSETEMSSGDLSPLNQLVWEGRVGIVGDPKGWYRRYYADPDISGTLIEHAPVKEIGDPRSNRLVKFDDQWLSPACIGGSHPLCIAPGCECGCHE